MLEEFLCLISHIYLIYKFYMNYLLTETEINSIKRRLFLNEGEEMTMEKAFESCNLEKINNIEDIKGCLGNTVKNQKTQNTTSKRSINSAIQNLDKIGSNIVKDNIVKLYGHLHTKYITKTPFTKVKNFSNTINLLFEMLPEDERFLHSEMVLDELITHLDWADDLSLSKAKIAGVIRALQCYMLGHRGKNSKKCTRITQHDAINFSKELIGLRHKEYQQYENSFARFCFRVDSSSPKITNKNTKELMALKVMGKEQTIKYLDSVVNKIYTHIFYFMGNSKNNETKKYDIIYKCDEPIKYGDTTLITNGDKIEVKKMKHTKNSYLSEFLAIGKNSEYNDLFKEDGIFLRNYEYIIKQLFFKLKDKEEKFVDFIVGDLKGMFFDNYLYTPIENVNIYLDLKGHGREKRLTLRFNVIDTENHIYQMVRGEGKELSFVEA